MIDKYARLLWQDVLKNGKGDNVITKFNIDREEVRVFLEYTKPEMFVNEGINKENLLEIKELKQKAKNISNIIDKKNSSSMMFNVMFVIYFLTVAPILVLIAFIKYVL